MNKQELKYIVYSSLFAITWFFFLLPKAIEMFDGDSPLTQFCIFNIGLYVILFIFLKALSSGSKSSLSGAMGLIALFLALDIWMPEYHVGFAGNLIPGATLGLSTTDYATGLIGQSLGLHGFLVFAFTYLAVPLVLLIISAKLLPNFTRRL